MTQEKALPIEPELEDNSEELDKAIDDLRGVLQQDSEAQEREDARKLAGDEPGSDLYGSDELAGPGDLASAMPEFESGESMPEADPLAMFADATADLAEDPGQLKTASRSATRASPASGSSHAPAAPADSQGLVMDIPIDVQIVLGSSRMPVAGLLNLNEGATIGLDRKIGEPVDIMVNGKLIGRGEITVLEEDETRFGVRLVELATTR